MAALFPDFLTLYFWPHLWFINSSIGFMQVSLDKLEWETLHRHSRTNIFQLTIAAARPMPCAAADNRMIFPSSRPMVLTCAGTEWHRNVTKIGQHHPWESDASIFPHSKTRHDPGVPLPSQLSCLALRGRAAPPFIIFYFLIFFSYKGLQEVKGILTQKLKLHYNRN